MRHAKRETPPTANGERFTRFNACIWAEQTLRESVAPVQTTCNIVPHRQHIAAWLFVLPSCSEEK